MSEQPPTRAPKPTSSAIDLPAVFILMAPAVGLSVLKLSVFAFSVPDVSVLDLDDIGPSLAHIENVTDERLLVAEREPHVRRSDLGLAHQEEVDVVRRQRVVER